MKKYIDARNLPNPQPLVYTKRALADGEFSYLIVHVNNTTARENVIRFARHAGFPVEKTEEREGEFFITIANTEELSTTVDPKPQDSGSAPSDEHWADEHWAEEHRSEEQPPRPPSPEAESSEKKTAEHHSSASSSSESSSFAGRSTAEAGEKTSAGLPLRQHQETVKTLLLGTGRSVFQDKQGNLTVTPFLDRFLRTLPKIYGDLQQIILTDGASLLGSPHSDYLPLLKTLQRMGVQIYCDEESCDEWDAAPSPEAVTLIDAESLTQKLLRYAPVLTL